MRRNKEFVFMAAIVCLSVLLVIFAVSRLSESVPVITSAKPFNQIVLDAGHGGIDAGATGVNRALEKNINLSITIALRDMLIIGGYDAVLTRDKDESKHDPSITKIPRYKKSDLRNRLKIITNNPNSITVSIHQNKYPSPSERGAQIFYSDNNPLSLQLAQRIQDEFAAKLQPWNDRKIKPDKGAYFLLKETKTPIVLAECGFLSNYKEAALLSTEDYQHRTAFTLFCAIVKFMEDHNATETSL
ncbi:MAG: N-acetylmuramoyl-L-alanine amidase [Oscillospiraceae bacterium]|nr:N-acetylmuramoyl-L-alanine amidase [Oscillospiraceae bacterium]